MPCGSLPPPVPSPPSPRSNIREVHRLALAADRAQVVTVKASIVDFCSTPGVAPDSVCERPYGKHLADLNAALDDLEQYHQVGVS